MSESGSTSAATPAVAIPLIVSPAWLLEQSSAHGSATLQLQCVDLRKPEDFATGHVPGAIHLSYGSIVRSEKPVGGLLPAATELAEALAAAGVDATAHLVVMDGEGGGAAGRLIWTLHSYGWHHCSLLDGGVPAWTAAGHPLEKGAVAPARTDVSTVLQQLSNRDSNVVTTVDELKSRLAEPDLSLLDARSIEEYDGSKVVSRRGGHIPGAKRVEWTDMMDHNRQRQLLDDATLLAKLESAGFSPEQNVVVYCQTHHRSSLSYVVLKHLGYENVAGLEGAWSDWGNRDDTPIET